MSGVLSLAASLAATSISLIGAAPAPAQDLSNLPLGDDRTSDEPRKGYVMSCMQYGQGGGPEGPPGAFRAGPWLDEQANRWDATKKIAVQGSNAVNGTFRVTLGNSTRSLSGNGLPTNHNVGTFPVAQDDPAYEYDRNPNRIQANDIRMSVPSNPKRNSDATCIGGEVGVMTSGVRLFNAFDAGGRDAVAHEIQDACDGHPQRTGQYHYHSLSRCLKDSSNGHSKLMGWAFDGFGIYGPRGEKGVTLTSSKLDACHGHTHTITWNGKRRRMYHYHATADFPYTVSCFRGTPVRG
jgi:hypothetical protein